MITSEQRDQFERDGYVRLPDVFAKEDAKAMENLLWERLKVDYQADRNDPSTWSIPHVGGLQELKTHPAFDAVASSSMIEAIDSFLGAGMWEKPVHWGQFLITFPKDDAWIVPNMWHTDFDFASNPLALQGVLVFCFLGNVSFQSGGTGVLSGSHRYIEQLLALNPSLIGAKMKTVRKAIIDSDPWLQELNAAEVLPGRNERFMASYHEIDGVSMKVTELTGKAGDVVIAHPWLWHSPSPNCGEYPRFMRIKRIHAKK